MKVLVSVLFLAVLSQESYLGVEGAPAIIPGIINRLVEDVSNLLNSAVKDVSGLLASLDSTLSNLTTSVLRTVFNLVDDLLSLVDSLSLEALNSGKVIDECVNRVDDLKLLKQNISTASDTCRKNFDVVRAGIFSELEEQLDRGKIVISSLTKSLENCLDGLFVFSCISQSQQSSLKQIQDIIKKADNISRRVSSASNEVTNCLNDAENEGRKLANEIYQEIELCVSQVTNIE